MTRVSKRTNRAAAPTAALQRHMQRFLEVRQELAQIQPFCKASVLKRTITCGRAQCACHSDRAKRHGPYTQMTYKANGKTVGRFLSPEAAPLYLDAARQYRKLKTLLRDLDKISKAILVQQAKLAESKSQN